VTEEIRRVIGNTIGGGKEGERRGRSFGVSLEDMRIVWENTSSAYGGVKGRLTTDSIDDEVEALDLAATGGFDGVMINEILGKGMFVIRDDLNSESARKVKGKG
jgi:hypothetical protein